MVREKTKTEIGWESLFDKFNIINEISKNGYFEITAGDIKRISNREPRLMTKFDNTRQLPEIMRLNKLSILPNTRGTYLIGKFKTYKKFEQLEKKPIVKTLPEEIQSIDSKNISSEAVALNAAKASGMIDYVLNKSGESSSSSYLTLSGRMGSGDFNYKIGVKGTNDLFDINVENSQVEVDATYEGLDTIGIFEAKTKLPENFITRQLYYPYRVYGNMNMTKKIIPIFFTYVDDIFSFSTYKFKRDDIYSSIEKVDQFDFILDENLDISIDEIKEIARNVHLVKDSGIFPQANSFSRILDMIDFLKEPKDKYDLEEEYGFADRQGDYYGNALVYLGYAQKGIRDKKFALTSKGLEIRKMPNGNTRNRQIIKDILSHATFNYAFKLFFENECSFENGYQEKVTKYIVDNERDIKGNSVAPRRASSVKHWVSWIISVAE